MKTLHVHIGTPKTGTTSIQNFCCENQRLLEKKGYCYPMFPYSYKGIAKVRNGHFLLGRIIDANGVQDVKREGEIYQEGIGKLRELFKLYDDIILSDEGIWRRMDSVKKSFWTDLKQASQQEGFQIHAIVYLRRQDKLYISHWNQVVKAKTGAIADYTLQEALEKDNLGIWLEYYEKIERIASIIGKENITVRRFDKKHFTQGNLYADFLETVGLSLTEEYSISQDVRNIGLYGNTHEIKRVLNSLPELSNHAVNTFFVNSLWEISGVSKQEYPSEMMSKEETEAFLRTYQEGNRKIAEEYLGEPGGELFDEPISDLPKWQKDNPYMYDDLIRFAGVTAIRLLEENQKLKKEIKSLSNFRNHVNHPFKTLFRRIKRWLGV